MPSYARFGKRVLDLTLASIACIPALPVIALAAVAIKLDSRGPVFHRAVRVGRGGRQFTFFKLRSIHDGAEEVWGAPPLPNHGQGAPAKLPNQPPRARAGPGLPP